MPPAGNPQALEEGWKGLLIRLRETGLLEKPPLARAGPQGQPSSPREAEPVSKGWDSTPLPCDAPSFQVAGRVSPAFPQWGIGAAPPLRLLLAGAVLVLPLTVPAEAQHGDCHCWGFRGVSGWGGNNHEGTDEQRTLSSKRDNSQHSGAVTPSTHVAGQRDWTPPIVPRGSSSVFQWLCTAKNGSQGAVFVGAVCI